MLLIAPFFMLQENDSKAFWTMIITNVHILFLLFVTLSGNIYAITSWLLVDVCHILYFCYFCVVLVTQFINGMGGNTNGNCSLFTIAPEGSDCNGMKTQFKSVATVFIIVFVIVL